MGPLFVIKINMNVILCTRQRKRELTFVLRTCPRNLLDWLRRSSESKVPFSEALIGLGVVPNITSPSFFFISFKEVYIFISLYSDENTTKKLALWTLKKCCYDHISYNLCKPKISKHPILVFTVYMEFKYIQICVEYMKPIPDNICILILIALWIIFWRFCADELAF